MNPQDLVQRWSKEKRKILVTRTGGSTEEEVELFLCQVCGKLSEVQDLTEYFAVPVQKMHQANDILLKELVTGH